MFDEASQTHYHYADYKTIVSAKGGMNLYRGCTHGCIYCDTRSDCYQLAGDFEDIEVKSNAARILDAQLSRKRKPHMISTGSMCDPYLPLEATLEQTRACLEVIAHHDFGVSVLTKSTLALRDIDLLTAINNRSKVVVQTTFTTYDDELCRQLEPRVATTRQRADMLAAMHAAGISTVVWLGPFLPHINDDEDNLRGLLRLCDVAQVRAILCFGFGMTLRAGSREHYYERLDQLFPGMADRYRVEFGDAYHVPSPRHARLMAILRDFCRSRDIIWRPDEVFAYLADFPNPQQLSLFD